jgi:hypothetical protein
LSIAARYSMLQINFLNRLNGRLTMVGDIQLYVRAVETNAEFLYETVLNVYK